MRKINNVRLQDFLYENGIEPVEEDDLGAAYYKESAQFLSLLDKYYIRFKIFPNKL